MALISDYLYQHDPDGTKIKATADIKKLVEGGKMYTVAIGDGDDYKHGDYKDPCNSCGPLLSRLGIIAFGP